MWLVGVTVRRYIHVDILIINTTFPTPLVLALFLAAAPLLCLFLNDFLFFYSKLMESLTYHNSHLAHSSVDESYRQI